MPATQVRFFRNEQGVPVLEWLRTLRRADQAAYAKCVARIRLLGQLGVELRRPLTDYLDQGIYELRVRRGRIHYRILYFFHGRSVALLTHGCVKEGAVPLTELERALARKHAFLRDPEKHTYEEDPSDV